MATVALVAAVFLLYGRVGGYGFTGWDDGAYIHEHKVVLQGLTTAGWNYAWRIKHSGGGDHETKPHGANWHPLTTLSHMLDCQMFPDRNAPHGQWAGGHHLVNVLLHAANVVLLLLVVWRMTAAFWPSVAVATMFAIHPMHVESVAWVSERKDVLSGLFWMLTLLAYAYYAAAPSIGRYLFVAICLVLGLLAKPMVVTLPVILCLLDIWPLRRWDKLRSGTGTQDAPSHFPKRTTTWLILEKLPLFAIVGLVSVITVIAQSQLSAVVGLRELPVPHRLVNAAVSLAGYLRRLVLPADLAVFYPHPLMIDARRFSALLPWAGAATLLLAALTAAIVFLGRRRHYLITGWLWFLIALLPVIGLMQVGSQALADRYAYLPYIGLYIILAFGARDLIVAFPGLRWPMVGVAVATLIYWSVAAGRQVTYWESNRTLSMHALEVTEDNFFAHFRLAEEYDREGNLQEAARHYEAGLANSRNPSSCASLGFIYLKLRSGLPPNRLKERQQYADWAVDLFGLALSAVPGNQQLSLGMAQALEAQGNFPQAIRLYNEVLKFDPDCFPAHNGLAIVYTMQQNYAAAAAALEKAVQSAPNHPQGHFNLGQVLEQLQRLPEAEQHYRRALEIDPRYPRAAQNLARVQEALRKQGR